MFDWFAAAADADPILFAILYVAFRAFAVVASPIPGALLDVPAVGVFGWQVAFLLAEIGVMTGALTAFGVARHFRERVVAKFVSLRKVQEWESALPPADRFAAWIALRFPSNLAFDYISYAAGLTNCSIGVFFWSTLLGNLPVMLGFFLLAGIGIEINGILAWVLPGIFLLVVAFIFERSRHKMRPK